MRLWRVNSPKMAAFYDILEHFIQVALTDKKAPKAINSTPKSWPPGESSYAENTIIAPPKAAMTMELRPNNTLCFFMLLKD